jgi:hypothetical protein
MELVNLTPHAIKIADYGTVEPSGTVARVNMVSEISDELCGIQVVRRVECGVDGLPEPKDGVAYIVSSMVLAACEYRNDVYAPDTGETAVRDDKGRIQAVTRLVRS